MHYHLNKLIGPVTLSGLLTLAGAARAEALIWLPFTLIAWLLKAKVIAAVVTVATIASGVHAMVEVADRAGYRLMPDSSVESNGRLLGEEYRRVHEQARDFHPMRFCLSEHGERLLVHDGVRFCPFDGAEPQVEDHFVFTRDGDELKVEVRRPRG